ncbi:helix-turn-helix domain-containing protein [Microvirga pakistanensis]|uniref:helix-turn-helix domain-containing protein n=1 Tax=Microvirga pakistanensis TaxID=1682650 RepID=UPI00106B57E1|nr:helix-turn-helix domain-containing protein [Microvirga pakistanensis]
MTEGSVKTSAVIERADERRIELRFLMSLMRLLTSAKNAPMASGADSILIIGAVAMGQIEGKPFRASKLAEYVGMPRPTLLRRLSNLIEEGWIESTENGQYLLGSEHLNSPLILSLTDQIKNLILEAASDLQKAHQKS